MTVGDTAYQYEKPPRIPLQRHRPDLFELEDIVCKSLVESSLGYHTVSIFKPLILIAK